MKNFKPFKNRVLNSDKVCKVYRNLNNGKISITQSGLVIGHCDDVTILSAKFKVSEKGRQRVIKEKRKNVHAFVEGFVDLVNIVKRPVAVTYNPYKYDSFVEKDNPDAEVHFAMLASVSSNGSIAIDGAFYKS